MLFQKLFGNNRESNKQQKSNAPQARRLRIESLESRELLAVTPADFDSIRALYPDLNLAASMGSYNIIEIEAANLTDNDLRNALTQAGNTTQNDLIVVRTTQTYNKIILAGTELGITTAASSRGSITIVSLGDVPLTIDANKNTRVFNLGNSSTVALGGLTITGGNVTGTSNHGGAILSAGLLTITDCTITGNTTAANGGGIYVNGGTLTVTNSAFSGNSAVNGGGIYRNTGTLTVTHCGITENVATTNGGGIWGTSTLTNSIIAGNRAASGGGIYGSATVINSTIVGNSASASGGGIWSNGSTVINSTIAGNRATTSGSGIYVDSARTVLNNTIVAKNFGSSYEIHCNAGSVVGSYNLIGNVSSLSSFTNGINGNIIGTQVAPVDPKFVASPTNATWTNSLWKSWDLRLASDSPAVDKGRNEFAVASGSSLRFDLDGKSRIVGGTVDMGAYEYRAAEIPATTPANFRSTSKTNNSVTLEWSAVTGATSYEVQYRRSGTTTWTSASGTQTSRTVTGLDGDTTYEFQIRTPGGNWSQVLTVKTNATMSSTEFNTIRTQYPGLSLSPSMTDYNIIVIAADQLVEEINLRNAIAVGATKNTLIVCRTTTTQNRTTLAGTELTINGTVAIVSLGSVPLTIDANKDSRIFNVATTSSSAALGGLTITNGTSTSGGGIYSNGALTMDNCTISGNSTSGYGGGIYRASGTLTIVNSAVSNNTGIGIHTAGSSTVTVTNCTISGNSSSGIYSTGAHAVTVSDSTISKNTVSGIYRSGGTISVVNCIISENTAGSGGGIYNYNTTATITNSTITENTAYDGGGIYGACTVTNCIISGNTASNVGGGIYGSGTVKDSTITENKASSGGGIYTSNTMTITNTTISENSTTGNGGGIYQYSGTLTVTGSTISGNRAANGGGIYGVCTVTNTMISGNTASTNGGGIYATGTSRVVNSVLLNNRGSGIYTTGTSATLTVTNSTVAWNPNYGIHVNGGTATINNTIVAKNTTGDIFRNTGTLTGTSNLIGNGAGQTSLVNGANGNLVGTSGSPIDPLFVDVSTWNLRLTSTSPAIDQGNNTLAVNATGGTILTDFDGKSRFFNDIVDIGAYEYDGTTIELPAVPVNFRSTAKSTNSVTLQWDTVSGATGYEIQYRRSGTTTWTPITVSGTQRMVAGLTDNTVYEFQVLASNVSGKSAWSASIFVTTNAIVVTDAPTHRLFAANNGSEIGAINVAAGGTFSFDVRHGLLNLTTPIDCFGIGIKVLYDPEYLEYIGYTDVLRVDRIGYPADSTPPGTITMAWNQMDQDWLRDVKDSLGTISVFDLIKGLQFKVKDGVDKNDDIFITLDFTSYDTYAGFEVAPPQNVKINIVTASLDINDDGNVNVYDANLLLRHSFGYRKYWTTRGWYCK